MTDKQIIVDGVDVSKCKYFSKYQKIVRNNECIVDIQNACVEEIETKPCWQEHNCYFKNWQRKEQECEELTSKCSQLEEKLQKYQDREQWEIELNKKCADSFKELRKMLYGKFDGNSLIEKRSPNEF